MYTKRARALLAVSSLLLVAATATVLPTAAHTTDGGVNPFHCMGTHGGATTVSAGSTVVITTGWFTNYLGDQRTFLDAQTTIVSWNDGAMMDVSDSWVGPTYVDGLWKTFFEVDTGVTLVQPGDQMRFTITTVLDRGITEQFRPKPDYPGPPGVYDEGLLWGGTCIVTAE